MTVTPLFPPCECSRCRRDAIDERLMRKFLLAGGSPDIWASEYHPWIADLADPEAESLARAVADLNDELAVRT
jgi:hypothetical protein